MPGLVSMTVSGRTTPFSMAVAIEKGLSVENLDYF